MKELKTGSINSIFRNLDCSVSIKGNYGVVMIDPIFRELQAIIESVIYSAGIVRKWYITWRRVVKVS